MTTTTTTTNTSTTTTRTTTRTKSMTATTTARTMTTTTTTTTTMPTTYLGRQKLIRLTLGSGHPLHTKNVTWLWNWTETDSKTWITRLRRRWTKFSILLKFVANEKSFNSQMIRFVWNWFRELNKTSSHINEPFLTVWITVLSKNDGQIVWRQIISSW